MHIFGNGDYSITSNGTDVFIKTSIEIFPNNSFLMSKFSLNMSIDSAQLMMTNFMGGDPSLQHLLDFIAQTIPVEAPIMMDLIQESLNFTVTHFINSIVASVFSWDEIVSMIQSCA
uniref:Lipid-binding serum glycoprotein C-terminal domain-containing protein n=1 Tax=Homalodisca liturata TaxID=320908 RepID=A0A1B6HL96_9HEMI